MTSPAPMPLRVRGYLGLVVLGGGVAGVSALGALGGTPIDVLAVALVVLGVLTATSTVPIPGTGVRLNADTPFLLALVALGHGPEAVLLAGVNMAVATLMSGLGRRRPLTIPFNASAGMLGGVAALGLHRASEGLPEPMPLMAAALAMFVANSAIVAGAVRVTTGRLPDREWREGLLVSGLGYLASASIALLLGLVPNGATAALVAIPLVGIVLLAWRTHQGRAEERAERVREREELFLPTLEALVAAIEARDERTHGHNRRVRSYALGLARAMGIDDEGVLTALGYGALLHDVGKIAIPDALLHSDRALGEADLARVRKHAEIGSDLIRHVPFPEGVVEVVRHHHERWDGRGYPDRLAGEAIPLAARIVAICEAFDDLRTGGGWREPVSQAEALLAIERDGGTAFEPRLAETFVRWQRGRVDSDEEAGRWSAANEAIRESSLEQARLHDLAYRDDLTGLGNGRALRRDLEVACAAGGVVGVLMLDLDGFKGINDHYGHAIGDDALRLVGGGLARLERPDRRCYRNGGDEFVVVLPGVQPVALVRHAEEVREGLENLRIVLSPREYVPIRVSVGGTAAAGVTVDELLREADRAMYEVKQARKQNRPRGSRPEVRRVATGDLPGRAHGA